MEKNKPIIHFQIPMRENSGLDDDFTVSLACLNAFMQLMNSKIGDRYDIICSPMVADISQSDVDIVNVKNITMDDIERILKEKNNEKRCNRSHDGYKGFVSKDKAKHEMMGLTPIIKHKKIWRTDIAKRGEVK